MNDSAKLPPHLSAHSDTDLKHPVSSTPQPTPSAEEPLALTLKGSDGNDVRLTSSQLESWFAAIEREESKAQSTPGITPDLSLAALQRDPYFATQFVGRYGMKSSKDVIAFLKSPAGDSVKIMLGEQLAQMAALQEFQREEYQAHEIRQHRMLAFLLLGLLYREAHARHVVEMNSQQADARVQQGETNLAQDQQKAREQRTAALNQTLSSYNTTAAALQSKLKEKEQELANVDNALHAMNPEEMALRYETFDKHLAELDNQLQLPALDLDQQIASLESEKAAIEAQLQAQNPESLNQALVDPHAPPQLLDQAVLHDKLAHLSERIKALNDQKAATANAHLPLIEGKIGQLSETMEDQLTEIQQLLERGTPEDEAAARKLLQEHNGLHLQVAGLKDMMAVMKGEKVLYTQDGHIAPSFNDAAFVLPKDKKVVKDGGKYYLIGAGQNLSAMNEHDVLQAQKDFERARPEISNLKNLVNHNHNLEHERLEKAQEKSKTLHNDIMTLRNQLNQIQAARSNVVAEMQKLNPTITPESLVRPTLPTPTPSSPGGPTPKPTQQLSPSQVYKMMMTIIQQLPNVKPTELAEKLDKEVKERCNGKPVDPNVKKYLKKVTDWLLGRAPVPDIPMRSVIENMPRFGADPEKGNVKPPSPTPFSTKPRP